MKNRILGEYVFNTKNLFFIFSFITLLISVIIKIKLNFHYEDEIIMELTEFLSANSWLMIFVIVNIIIVFVSALGTGIFINIIGNINSGTYKDMKKDIYTLHFCVYTLINLLLTLGSVFTQRALNLIEVNALNIMFFGFLSFVLFLLVRNWLNRNKSLRIVLYIFILNSAFPIWYIINEI